MLIPAYGEITYPRIGHFTTNDFKDPTIRPVVFLPQSPEHIKTRFLLYTRKNLKDEQHINYDDHESIKKSNFDGTKQTKFIVHGFLDNPSLGPYMKDMKDEFLAVGDYNVVIVDWSGGNGLPYTQATANTRVVGPVIALLVLDLKVSSMNPMTRIAINVCLTECNGTSLTRRPYFGSFLGLTRRGLCRRVPQGTDRSYHRIGPCWLV